MASGSLNVLVFAWILGLVQSAAVGVARSWVPLGKALGARGEIFTSIQTVYVCSTAAEGGNLLVNTVDKDNPQASQPTILRRTVSSIVCNV